MKKSDIIEALFDLEDGVSYAFECFSNSTDLDHLVRTDYKDGATIIWFPDESDICFCEKCEEAWLKGEASRCICGQGDNGSNGNGSTCG